MSTTARLLAVGTLPVGFLSALLFGQTAEVFVLTWLGYSLLAMAVILFRWWNDSVYRRGGWTEVPVEIVDSRDELHERLRSREPEIVTNAYGQKFAVWWHHHGPSCALSATGHRGPCTCGARRGVLT